MNIQRSATAEKIYRNDARLNVRSAGVNSGAKRRVSESDLRWADVVFVMEREHKEWIVSRFKHLHRPRIDVLDIPDEFEFMEDQLQEMLRMMLDPEIEYILKSGG